MAILEQYFYHNTIRMYTSMFGAIFNTIQIRKPNAQLVKVPIRYQGKDRQMERRTVDDPDAVRFQSQLPRMSYNLVSIQRDSDRQKNKMQAITYRNTSGATPVAYKQYNRVPFKFGFDLEIKTKYMDEMLQIIEQIVVWFSDSIEVTVKDNPDMDGESSISISLQSTTPNNSFEGIFDDGNQIETTLTFTVDGYLYKPTSQSGLIEKIYLNYFDLETSTQFDQDIIVPEV